MKTILVLVAAGVVSGLAAGRATAAKPAPAPTCGTDFYVNTQFTGTSDAPGAYNLVGDTSPSFDNGGTRTNKIEGRFQIRNCSHDYTLNLYYSSRRYTAILANGLTLPGRSFNIDRVGSVPLTPTDATPIGDPTIAAFDAWCARGWVVDGDGRIFKDASLGYLDNYAGCVTEPNGDRYVRRAAVFVLPSGNTDARLDFQASPQDMNAPSCVDTPEICTSSYVRVYHRTANKWVITLEEGPGGILRNRGVTSTEWVPFEITVTIP